MMRAFLARAWGIARLRGIVGAGQAPRVADPLAGTSDVSSALTAAIGEHQRVARELEEAMGAQKRILVQLREQLKALGSLPVGTVPDSISSPPEPVSDELSGHDLAGRLLGPFELRVQGTPVTSWDSRKAVSLLKYLLLNADRPARRDTLMGVFWPEFDAKPARNNLNVAIYQLRRALRTVDPTRTYVMYGDGAYRLNPEVTWWTDVEGFSRAMAEGHRAADRGDGRSALTSLRRAHQLYGGALLEDDSSGTWFLDAQRRLHLEHNGLLERLGTLLLEHGQLAESARLGEHLIAEDPCRETGHQLLMRVYAALQQPHLVAQQYHQCAEILQRELSVMPAPATTELFRRLVPVP